MNTQKINTHYMTFLAKKNLDEIDQHLTNALAMIEFYKQLKSDVLFAKQYVNNSIVKINDPTNDLTNEPLNTETNNLEIEMNSDTENEIKFNDVELWKNIDMYGITFNYQISNHGRVRNKTNNYILSQNIRDGYKSVCLIYNDFDNKSQNKYIKIHRMVGIMFVANDDPENKTVVNHIDGNKHNNHWTNFEWVTPSQNVQHAVDTGLIKITKRRVIQYDLNMNEIATFDSLKEASVSTKIDDGSITKACKGSRKSAGGFIWKYADVNPNEVILTEEELETYVQLKEYPNYYINRAGKLYSKAYCKFIKTTTTRDGSVQLQVSKDNKHKTYLVHNLMAEVFMEKEAGNPIIHHLNGNKLDNRLVNLAWTNFSDLYKYKKNNPNLNNNEPTDFTIDV